MRFRFTKIITSVTVMYLEARTHANNLLECLFGDGGAVGTVEFVQGGASKVDESFIGHLGALFDILKRETR